MLVRFVVFGAVLLALAGCNFERRAFDACVEHLRDRVRGPSSLKVIRHQLTHREGDEFTFSIRYEALNAMGGPVTSTTYCRATISGGRATVNSFTSD
jgi:hypothetical protein